MAKSVTDYQNLVTSEYTDQPNFMAMIAFLAAIPVQVQKLMDQMTETIFNLDTPPVGDQLDIIGEWVGISRLVTVPVTGVYFTWDDTTPFTGWDYGVWQPSTQPTSITSLPDDVYLTLIRATIAANNWDGTTTGAYLIWDQVFPQYRILIQDNCNMTYDFGIVGGIIDSLTLALILGGYIQLRPEGVRVDKYFVAVDTNPAFCWDIENANGQGWNQGSWLRELTPT